MTHGELLTHQVLVKDIMSKIPNRNKQTLLACFFDKIKELQNTNLSFSSSEMEKYLLENTI